MVYRVFLALVATLLSTASTTTGDAFQNTLADRALKLSTVAPGASCPVTQGSRDIVPHLDYIFGSGGMWFGSGPVYVNLAWKGDWLPPARFDFNKIPFYDGKPWPAKTPVAAEPSFTGAVLIRGRFLQDERAAMMFNSPSGPVDRLELQAPQGGPGPNTWSFWPTGMIIPKPGCYGLQIDTRNGTELITFEAAK